MVLNPLYSTYLSSNTNWFNKDSINNEIIKTLKNKIGKNENGGECSLVKFSRLITNENKIRFNFNDDLKKFDTEYFETTKLNFSKLTKL